MCGYCATDLCLCFCMYAKSRFSHEDAQMILNIIHVENDTFITMKLFVCQTFYIEMNAF